MQEVREMAKAAGQSFPGFTPPKGETQEQVSLVYKGKVVSIYPLCLCPPPRLIPSVTLRSCPPLCINVGPLSLNTTHIIPLDGRKDTFSEPLGLFEMH